MTDTPPKRGRGQPTLFTPEAEARLLQAVRLGLPFEKAAALVGVSSRTIRNWRAKGAKSPVGSALADFEAKVEQAVAEGTLLHLGRLDHASRGVRVDAEGNKVAFEGDAQVSRWFVEWQCGKAESRHKVDVTSGDKPLAAPVTNVVFRVGRDVVDRVESEHPDHDADGDGE